MQPTVRDLRSATEDLAVVDAAAHASFKVLNKFFNALAYDPPGAAESFLFWSAWGAHNGATLFDLQDAHGPVRRGLVLLSCSGYDTLEPWSRATRSSGMITRLNNFPPEAAACPHNTSDDRRAVTMIKQTPSVGRIFAMVAFALSCFGDPLFLWLSFGGSVPLQPRGLPRRRSPSRRPRSWPRRRTCASPA